MSEGNQKEQNLKIWTISRKKRISKRTDNCWHRSLEVRRKEVSSWLMYHCGDKIKKSAIAPMNL